MQAQTVAGPHAVGPEHRHAGDCAADRGSPSDSLVEVSASADAAAKPLNSSGRHCASQLSRRDPPGSQGLTARHVSKRAENIIYNPRVSEKMEQRGGGGQIGGSRTKDLAEDE